jgi:aminopeptidase 2
MCRAQALEGAGSAVDVSAAREVLPDNVKAVHYHVTLEPNLKTFEYDGEVVIE